jgi:transcriptional regulator of acetoin/glycerol metabolism
MSDCVLWPKALNQNGYGIVNRRTYGEALAHRLALRELHVPIAGLCVLHTCDTPACVNPDHLTVGTHRDNMADAGRKGRQSNRPQNKRTLSPALVAAIQSHPSNNITHIARELGVKRDTVRKYRHHRKDYE